MYPVGSHKIPLKILVFETPLPLRISNDPPWVGYEYFLEPHNVEQYIHIFFAAIT